MYVIVLTKRKANQDFEDVQVYGPYPTKEWADKDQEIAKGLIGEQWNLRVAYLHPMLGG